MSDSDSSEGRGRQAPAGPPGGAGAGDRLSADFEAETRRQARIIAGSRAEGDDQAFVDSISTFDDYDEETAGGGHRNATER